MERKKLYVLTGFLGAGKTTLLEYLLKELPQLTNKRIGVIQNEFGKLGVDGEILQRDGIEMIEISRGSIFCSCLKLSFVQALSEMDKQDVDYVFVESSGLADPSNIEEILGAVTALSGAEYDFKGVICLVDAVNFPSQLADTATVDRQLAHCHLAALNKIDLVSEAELEAVKRLIREVNPLCAIIPCQNGVIGTDFLSEDLRLRQWAENEDSLNSPDNKPKTICLEYEGAISDSDLQAFLEAVLPESYRIKGFCLLNSGWRQVDVVERLIDLKETSARDKSQLVFLSKVGPMIIKTIDKAWKERLSHPMKLVN